MVISRIISKIIPNRNDRLLRKFNKDVIKVNALADTYRNYSESELQSKTADFKNRLANGESLDSLLPEAFATVREASSRVLNMRHFDVQLLGGMALHAGKIAEMQTGEGKTLVATLPAYLNALTGNSVHIVTVNEYLAKRDAEWMGAIYNYLGMSVATIVSGMNNAEKRQNYKADVVYGTNNEFGFDYLRDNMVYGVENLVQRGLYYAIVDEVDSILIDEARTPLIISGPSKESTQLYKIVDSVAKRLSCGGKDDIDVDCQIDEKNKQAYLTERGHSKVEELFIKEGLLEPNSNLYDPSNINLLSHLNASLKAVFLYKRDIDYVIVKKKISEIDYLNNYDSASNQAISNNPDATIELIYIVCPHTGRFMEGRRWSDRIHQAIEAKENVHIFEENQTLASITFQNYFRMYAKLSGMTGTAKFEAPEFYQIYNLEVVVIPSNKPVIRKDHSIRVYMTMDEKFTAILKEVKDCIDKNQPILVGTTSVEDSEKLSDLLAKENINHQVLNAKFHEKETHIIAQAGKPGTVTIATNMAGRGTDIVLGGNPHRDIANIQRDLTEEEKNNFKEKILEEWSKNNELVVKSGGLHVIGANTHESRRIDQQLRGRSGRQGDPGSSRFYVSLQDTLMRVFAAERIAPIMQRLGIAKGEAIEHRWLNNIIESAQRKVEAHNFDLRKHLLEYDDIANEQRKIIYDLRRDVLTSNQVMNFVQNIRKEVLDDLVHKYMETVLEFDKAQVEKLQDEIYNNFLCSVDLNTFIESNEDFSTKDIVEYILKIVEAAHTAAAANFDDIKLNHMLSSVLLDKIDNRWREHLANIDHLREGIHLRGYAQQNPKEEYRKESYQLFAHMLFCIKKDVILELSKLMANISPQEDLPKGEAIEDDLRRRNSKCSCGSGKKYKHCHGLLTNV